MCVCVTTLSGTFLLLRYIAFSLRLLGVLPSHVSCLLVRGSVGRRSKIWPFFLCHVGHAFVDRRSRRDEAEGGVGGDGAWDGEGVGAGVGCGNEGVVSSLGSHGGKWRKKESQRQLRRSPLGKGPPQRTEAVLSSEFAKVTERCCRGPWATPPPNSPLPHLPPTPVRQTSSWR